jgi:hypothetical protein
MFWKIGFPTFRLWAYLMEVFLETRRLHVIGYIRFVLILFQEIWYFLYHYDSYINLYSYLSPIYLMSDWVSDCCLTPIVSKPE